MAVADADIVIYGSNSMPTDDAATNIGGAIDTSIELAFTDVDPTGPVEAVSDGADTRTLTLYYITGAGALANETKTLDGTNPVAFTDDMAAILRMVLSATDGSRTVTVRKGSGGATLKTIGTGIDEVRRPFYNATANPSGGATKYYYEKCFIKNKSADSDLTGSTVALQADPSSVMAFGLESSLDGTDTNGVGNNRQVAPAGYTFDATTKNVANSQVLTHAKAQGVWLKMTVAAGATPIDSTFTLRLSGVNG